MGTSWWVDDFQGRLTAEQERMRRELRPRAVEAFFEEQEMEEEARMLGHRPRQTTRSSTPSASTTTPTTLGGE